MHFKTRIRELMRNAISDIDRMVIYEFLGKTKNSLDRWNPKHYDFNVDRFPIDPDLLRDDFPVSKVANLVEGLVGMYGDKYAIPLAEAIRKGIEAKEGALTEYDIDVPVLRRAKRTF